MTEFIKKAFHGITIVSFDNGGVVWAHFTAVLKALGHLDNEALTDNARRETARSIWYALDDDEKCEIPVRDSDGKEMLHRFVSEPGMYHIAAKFDTTMSKSFRRWITHELVPAYRKGELIKRDVEATGRELALQIQSIGTALVEAFDRIDKVEETANRHESEISQLKSQREEINQKIARLSGEADFVTVRSRMLAKNIRQRDVQKHAKNIGGICRELAIARRIDLPPKVVEGTYQVNQYPYELIDEVLEKEGLI